MLDHIEDTAGNQLAGATQTDLTVTYNPATNAMDLSVDDSYLRNDGDTLDSGSLVVASGANIAVATGGVITWVDAPTNPNDLANKNYVDNLVSGSTTWRDPIECPNLTDIVTAVPGSPVQAGSYIAYGGSYPQTWGGITDVAAGDIIEYDTGTWVRLGVVSATTRFIVTGEISPNLGSGLYDIGIRSKDLVEATSGTNLDQASSWSMPSNADHQAIYFGDANLIVGGDATGLLNDATVYDFDVDVNGTPNAISVIGSAAQTFTLLVAEINTDLTGATAAIVDGHIHITGDNVSDIILISHGTTVDLLATLTNFEEIRGTAALGTTVLAHNPGCLEFGHTYLYSHFNHNWTEIAGPGTVGAGVALSYTGNTLNFEPSELANTATLATDFIVLADTSNAEYPIKREVSSFLSEHNVATTSAGGALTASNGVELTANDFAVSIDSLAPATITTVDLLIFDDGGTGTNANTTVANFVADLDIVSGISADGILVRTANDTYASRTIVASVVAGDEGASIVNGDGVAGNPTIGVDITGQTVSLADMIQTTEFLVYDGTNNIKMTGTQIADGVSTILGGLGNAYTTIQGDTGSSTAGTSSDTLLFAGATNGGIVTLANDGIPDSVTFAMDLPDLAGGVGTVDLADIIAVGEGGTSTVSYTFQDVVDDLGIPHNIGALTGLVVGDGAGNFSDATIVASGVGAADGLVVTNGTGVAGDPTIGLDITGTPAAAENMAADDEILAYNTSGTANEKLTGQEVADGVATILGFGGLQVANVPASVGTQPVLVLADTTRANKLLSVGDTSVNWSENRINNNDWLQIGGAVDALSGYIVPLDATIVKVTAHTSDNNGNSKPILLYVDGVLNSTVATFNGASGEDHDEDVTINIDVNAGQKLRLRGGTGGKIEDTVVTLWIKWRA